MVIKLFKTLLVVIPTLIVVVLFIIALPDRSTYVIDMEGDLDAFEDPKLVTNSEIGFFYKNEQLYEYRQQSKPEKTSVFKMSENLVTTDFTKENITILPSKNSYTGSNNLILYQGDVVEYVSLENGNYNLKGGGTAPAEDSFKIILDTGLLGNTSSAPHRLEQVNTYYAAFTEELQNIYFEFEAGNEFASIVIDGLSGRVEYTLLDSSMKPIKNGWNNASPSIEVTYKGRSSAKYYLKLTGSYSENIQPFSIKLPSDENEWMWQMVYADITKETTGRFDYYGDEDFFVLPPEVTNNINKSVIYFSKLTGKSNVVIYDKDRNVLAQYIYEPGVTDKVSLYGLENAYAASVYSYDGSSSGSEYSIVFAHIDTLILDIQTYGFALSPGYSDNEDYYTAEIASLEEKQITDIMTSVPFDDMMITVEQQCGFEYVTEVGKELDLAPGRNTIKISFTLDDISRTITIVVSHRADEVYYGYKTNGEKVFIVDDSKDNTTVIQTSKGKYEEISNTKLFKYYETTMPASYKAQIEALKEAHPNWKFTFVKTGWDFNTYVDSQMAADSDGTPVSTYNSAKATREQVEFYVDPRNFLDEQNIFMFEKQTYGSSYSSKGISSIWQVGQAGENYANDLPYAVYFIEAGKSTGLSPYFITARAVLESGRGTSPLSTGIIKGYEGYYNFYGIGAYNSNPANGAVYAYESNWNTKRKAIIEGAAWVKNQYIGCMQYSAYFMKFCFITNREWHQYMTDIAAPAKDAASYYKAHAAGGTLDSEIEFVIPVFENMP